MDNFDTMLYVLIAISSLFSFMLYTGQFALIKRTLAFSFVGTVLITPVWLLEVAQVITL